MLSKLKKDLRDCASPQKAKILAGFFKTGPGQYGEGDVFLGIVVPDVRNIVKKFRDITLPDCIKLLHSKYHEERLTTLLILVLKYSKADKAEKQKIFNIYINNTRFINNWDLIDLTAEQIVGEYLSDKDKSLLYKFARSSSLWERRISILSTFNYIKRGDPKETLKVAKVLLNDGHDLIHKAVGWMLRETGKRCSQKTEEDFLKGHYKKMPRTMLRYAIEKFPEKTRKAYLSGTV
ncbi:MAG: DNA alkylation repair protein [Candidatus Saganbacteria bacterium]|nr:DNA alkylation repair protein [Candidatus Saganbacteria bacterium]